MNAFEELENARKENERIAAARQKKADAIFSRRQISQEIDRLYKSHSQCDAEIKDWEDFLRHNKPIDEAPLRQRVEEACLVPPWEEK